MQAATKWKRVALRQFDCAPGSGICTDMKAVRKDYFLDHDHSAYVDQWDWEKAITPAERNLDFLRDTVQKHLESAARRGPLSPGRCSHSWILDSYPDFPDELVFLHAEETAGDVP